MDIFEQLKRDESLRLKPYRDSVGKLTIGIGRNLDDDGISETEARVLLSNDVSAARAELFKTFPWAEQLDDARQGVLLNMTFNMGIVGLAEFKDFLAKLQAGNYMAASGAMLDSKWAQQVGPRATRLSIQIETGVWQ